MKTTAQTQELPTMMLKISSLSHKEVPMFDKGESEVIENVELIGPTLRLDSFFRLGDKHYIESQEMLRRAKEMENLAGQVHAEIMLKHQKDIPIEWRGHTLIFAGTVWRDHYGLHVPILIYCGTEWHLDFLWLVYINPLFNYHSSTPCLVRLCK